jgi:hypothetical protein
MSNVLVQVLSIVSTSQRSGVPHPHRKKTLKYTGPRAFIDTGLWYGDPPSIRYIYIIGGNNIRM